MMNVRDVATMLRIAPRCGGRDDQPEGRRYIIISDTLANRVADMLDTLSDDERAHNGR